MANAKTWGIVCALLGLAGCAENLGGPPAHATAAAAVSSSEESGDRRQVIRLRMESAQDPIQQAAFTVVRRTLFQQGFVVTSGFTEGYDADLVIQSRVEGPVAAVSLVGRVGVSAMLPLTTELARSSTEADTEAGLEDLTIRWQRRFNRSPRLDRHFVGDGE